MMWRRPLIAFTALSVVFCSSAITAAGKEKEMTEAEKQACAAKLHVNVHADNPLQPIATPAPQKCTPGKKNGFPVPDPKCTPGAVNPTLTVTVLSDPDFKTGCVRDQATSPEKKKETYTSYKVIEPKDNSGKNQTCELDHFISLELGGADTLDNIWPQCGPKNVQLGQRNFKQKDMVEDYLAFLVKNDRMALADAQKGIAADWTQFLAKARQVCPGGRCAMAKLPPKP
ncbi:MAG: hypothetical protein QOJ15_11859 [Bradyrhizobium sp.]|nr:hypothetical protein [Bradyrhizobium sp.]